MAWAGTALLPGGRWGNVRGSLSAYYYSGMREYFTCSLAITGLFLVAYKISQKRMWENWIATFAGFTVLFVAFFPTDRPTGDSVGLTSLQQAFGEGTVKGIHVGCAIAFIASLAVISVFFGEREGKRQPAPGRRSPTFWKWLHRGCAIAIALAGIFYAARRGLHPSFGHWINAHDLWLTEVVSVVAFATSWLFKGSEVTQL